MRPFCYSYAIRKLLFAALTLCLLAGALPLLCTNVLAVSYSGSCGKLKWTLNTATGLLNFTGSGEMPDFSDDEEPAWMQYADDIKQVKFAPGITRIGDNAFSCGGKTCGSLKQLSLPSTLLSIGSHAFEGASLSSVAFISTKLSSIGSFAFAGVPLTSANLPSNLTEIGAFAFAGCKLTSVTLPDGLETLEAGVFSGCGLLSSIEFGTQLKRVDLSAFLGCASLESLSFPDSVCELLCGFEPPMTLGPDVSGADELPALDVSFEGETAPDYSAAQDFISFAAARLRQLNVSYPSWQGGWFAAAQALSEAGISFSPRSGPEPAVSGVSELSIPASGAAARQVKFSLSAAQALNWSLEPACEGVSIDDSGLLTVTALAAESVAGSLQLKVIASFDGGSVEAPLLLRRDESRAVCIALSRDGQVLGGSDCLLLPASGCREVSYELILLDQYGAPMDADGALWSCSSDLPDFSEGKLRFDCHTPACSFVLSAAFEGLSAALKVRLCGLSFTGAVQTAPEAVYGMTWEELADLSSFSASFGSQPVEGEFSLDVSGRPDAGLRDYEVYFTAAGGSRYFVCRGSVELSPRPLRLTGLAAADKVYDGSLLGELEGCPGLDGLLPGDEVQLVPGAVRFASAAAGEAVEVRFSGFGLAGADASNYILLDPGPGAADILPCPDYTVLADERQGLEPGCADFVPPHFVGPAGDEVEGELEFSCSGEVLTRAELAARLSALGAGETLELDYTFRPSGNYCGERSGSLSLYAAAIDFYGEPSTAPRPVYGDSWEELVELSGLSASCEGRPVQGSFSLGETGLPQAGSQSCTVYFTNASGQRFEVCECRIEVAARPVYMTGLEIADKVYDGRTGAVMTGAPGLSGVLPGDDAALSPGTVSFASAGAGKDIELLFSGFRLSGSDAANYTLCLPEHAAGNILPSPEFSGPGLSEQCIPAGSGEFEPPRFTGCGGEEVEGELRYFCGGEELSAEELSILLSALGPGGQLDAGYSFTASGNYCGERSGSLSFKVSGLSFSGEVRTKSGPVYGDSWEELVELSGLSASFGGEPVDGSFSLDVSGRPQAGRQSYRVIFTDAQGQSCEVCSGVIELAAKGLSVVGLEAADKPFDGTTSAEWSGTPRLEGVLDGDEVLLIPGRAEFASAEPGEDIEVRFSGFALEGASAGNYSLVQPGPQRADITAEAPGSEPPETSPEEPSEEQPEAPPERLSLVGIEVEGKVYDGKPVAVEGKARLLDASGRPMERVSYMSFWLDGSGRLLEGPPKDAGSYVFRLLALSDANELLCEREYPCVIEPAQLTIAPDSLELMPGESLPEQGYRVFGLAEGERLAEEPALFVLDTDEPQCDSYTIIAFGAKAPDTGNYREEIIYLEGRLKLLNSAPEFTDVDKGAWYSEAVDYVFIHGIMDGVTGSEFAPEAEATRAMLVTMLYRLAGEPQAPVRTGFRDVDSSAWYAEAAAWARAEGVSEGIGDGLFAPGMAVTRGQLAALLYRSVTGAEANEGADMDMALLWAVSTGLLQGRGDGGLQPEAVATRAEIAVIFARLMSSGLCG